MDQQSTPKTIETRRLELESLLKSICNNVYFQPPANVRMSYPCIRYKRTSTSPMHADNKRFVNKMGYLLTYISKSPDSAVIDALLTLPYCSYESNFYVENLNHDVFTIYW